MKLKKALLFVSLTLLLAGFVRTQAGAPAFVVVNYPTVTTVDGFSRLSVFFTMTDANGRVAPVNSIESATMQLFGDATVYPAVVEKPNTPFYVVLLLDASGSMGGAMADMQEAAIASLQNAPPEARFAVVQFNENPNDVILDFTNNIGQVQSAIERVQVDPNAGTCLYDAIQASINMIDNRIESPEERRAVIVFTDGRDQLRVGDDTPCSLAIYEDVVNLARTPGSQTAVHTIGMSAEAGAINAAELRSMADETRGFSAIGDQATLNSLFAEIMAGLNNQWVARTDICAPAGPQKVTMGVKLREFDSLFTTTFDFVATGDPALCGEAGPPRCEAQTLNFQPAQDLYTLALACTNLEPTDRLVVSVEDERRGIQVGQDAVFENPGAARSIDLAAAGLEAGQEYIIRLRVVDEAGNLLQNEEGETTLALKTFLHEPPPLPPLALTIESINPNYETGELIINLQLPDQDLERLAGYRGFINREGTERVADLGPAALEQLQIIAPLPQAFVDDAGQFEYALTVQAIDADGVEGPPATVDFRTVPPEPPGFFPRLIAGLTQNPWIAGTIAAIVLLVGAWLIIDRRREQAPRPRGVSGPPVNQTMFNAAPILPLDPDPEPEPQTPFDFQGSSGSLPEEGGLATEVFVGAAVKSRRLRVRIIDTPSKDLVNTERIAEAFPYAIGRIGCELNIGGDGRLSRRHLVIEMRDGRFVMSDHSRNGSYIGDERLADGLPHPIPPTGVTVRLGSNTFIRLEPL